MNPLGTSGLSVIRGSSHKRYKKDHQRYLEYLAQSADLDARDVRFYSRTRLVAWKIEIVLVFDSFMLRIAVLMLTSDH
jgi:hypothetical protein